jgi:agmatinase
MNYGGLTKEESNYGTSKIVILPVPFDATSTWIKGSHRGPEAIMEASENMELYDIEAHQEVYKLGIHTAKPVKESSNPQKMVTEVHGRIKSLLEADKFPVIIGGEHSVSIGAFKAFSEKYSDLTILQLDAHTDLRDTYNKSKYNHACTMARAREVAPIFQVGIRSMSAEEANIIEVDRVIFADKIVDNDLWMIEVIMKLSKNVYITIDLDVFDTSVMPSTGTPEPGGLKWYPVLVFLRKMFESTNVVGFDVVELCPNKYNKAPDFMAAKLIYTLLNYKFKV